MIARIWHGRTEKSKLESYSDFLKEVAVPDYSQTKGFKGLIFMRSAEASVAHFNLVTFWEDLAAIKNFAGEDFEKAKYYPEDKQFLLEFEEKVRHHEVFATIAMK